MNLGQYVNLECTAENAVDRREDLVDSIEFLKIVDPKTMSLLRTSVTSSRTILIFVLVVRVSSLTMLPLSMSLTLLHGATELVLRAFGRMVIVVWLILCGTGLMVLLRIRRL
jgi:hypothetical protein